MIENNPEPSEERHSNVVEQVVLRELLVECKGKRPQRRGQKNGCMRSPIYDDEVLLGRRYPSMNDQNVEKAMDVRVLDHHRL